MYLDYLETFTITLIFFSVLVGGIVKGSVGIWIPIFIVPIIIIILVYSVIYFNLNSYKDKKWRPI